MTLRIAARNDRPGNVTNRRHPLFSPITAVALAVGVLVPLIFSASYVGALHDPKPHDMPIGVVAPYSMASTLITAIDTASQHELKAREEADTSALRSGIDKQEIAGGLVLKVPGAIPIGVLAPAIMAATLAHTIGARSGDVLAARVEPSADALKADLNAQKVYGGVVFSLPASIPIGVVAPSILAPAVAKQIGAAGGGVVTVRPEASVAALRSDIAKKAVYGGIVVAISTALGLAPVQVLTAGSTDYTVSQLIAGFGQQLAARLHTSVTLVDVKPQAAGAATPLTMVQIVTTSTADSTVGEIVATFGRQLAAAQHAGITVVDMVPQVPGTPKPLTTVQVYTAGAVNFTASRELAEFGQLFAVARHAAVTVTDAKPLQPEDSTGLSSLYMMIGWVFGGYFLATVVTTIVGFKQWTRRHSFVRLGALALCSIASGLMGAGIGAAFGPISSEHFWAVAGIGTLLVFSTACATAGLQAIIGMYGTQVALIAFIMLGNPSSGGIAAPQMLPVFWRAIGPWLPNAAGFTLLRNTLYYGGRNFGSAIPVLCAYTVAGAALLLMFGSSRMALFTPRVETAVDALRPGPPRLVGVKDEEASA